MMRFQAKENFKHWHMLFEQGNWYTAESYGIASADVDSFYAAGWAEVEGRDPAPARQVRGAVVQPDSGQIGQVVVGV